MKTAFYTGASGLMAFQQTLDNTGNNLTNVNTTGYKEQTQSFQDLIYTQMWSHAASKPLNGHGVREVGTGSAMTQGSVVPNSGTGFNYAVKDQDGSFGMFAVEDPDGNVYYTRDGSFAVDAEAEELVTRDGMYVLDSSGSHISVTGTDKNDDGALEDQIGVYTFTNPSALTPVSGTRFTANAQSGEAEALDPEEGQYKVLHGYLEQSNVSLQDQMADMIIAQRAYQMSARVVQTADEMEQVITSLRS